MLYGTGVEKIKAGRNQITKSMKSRKCAVQSIACRPPSAKEEIRGTSPAWDSDIYQVEKLRAVRLTKKDSSKKQYIVKLTSSGQGFKAKKLFNFGSRHIAVFKLQSDTNNPRKSDLKDKILDNSVWPRYVKLNRGFCGEVKNQR